MVNHFDQENLLNYFSWFGNLQNFRRVYTKDKKESGYAFFDVDTDQAQAFVARPHTILNALINCKIAADNSKISQYQKDEMERKVFVSSLPQGTTDLDLLHLFEPFGKLTKAYLVRNRADGSCKSFGFAIFQRKDDMERLLDDSPVLKFKQKKITIRRAVDRQTQKINKKCTKKTPLWVNRRQPSADQHFGSTKLQLLQRTTMLNQAESNYHFNFQVKNSSGAGFSPRIQAQAQTSSSLVNECSVHLFSANCRFGDLVHN